MVRETGGPCRTTGQCSRWDPGAFPTWKTRPLDMSERSVTFVCSAAGGNVARAEHGEEVVVSIAELTTILLQREKDVIDTSQSVSSDRQREERVAQHRTSNHLWDPAQMCLQLSTSRRMPPSPH